MSFFVPTKFFWRFGGHQVHLCGSFTRWVETVPMAPVDGQPGAFAVIVHLPPGYHQYKFIVDGEWRHDETQPFMPDPLGNVNNWLFVRRPETSTAGIPIVHSPQTTANLHHNAHHNHTPAADVSTQPNNDVDMHTTDSPGGEGVIAPIVMQPDEPEYTRKKIHDFLHTHTAYELIPESGKVVLLDVELPVRQAFHALHEQAIPSAPVWDPKSGRIVGMISASDFIHMLRKLRHSISHGANPMSEAEMDQHIIRVLREEAAMEGRPPKQLVYVRPEENLANVIQRLTDNRCSMAPILSQDPDSCRDCDVLHIATISGVLSCLMRHFRASFSSLPLLSQPIGGLPLGTWSPESSQARQDVTSRKEGTERRDHRKIRPLHYVHLHTPLTAALQLLLDAGCSVLPVVDENGVLLDMYARSDISMLAKGNSYNRLQAEDLSVGQALSLANFPWGNSGFGEAGTVPQKQQRVFMCTTQDTLRAVVDRLSVPGVRRLFVVDPDTRRVEGIISLSDVAAYLLL